MKLLIAPFVLAVALLLNGCAAERNHASLATRPEYSELPLSYSILTVADLAKIVPPKTAYLTVHTDPEGALISTGTKLLGVSPMQIAVTLTDQNISVGYVSVPLKATWNSGATSEMTPSIPWEQSYTGRLTNLPSAWLVRPANVPGHANDVAFLKSRQDALAQVNAQRVQELRRQQQAQKEQDAARQLHEQSLLEAWEKEKAEKQRESERQAARSDDGPGLGTFIFMMLLSGAAGAAQGWADAQSQR
jgi:hypothetical protein